MISSDHLDRGQTGQIRASVDTNGRSGPLVKHITVYSNDRAKRMLTLSLSMNVVLK